ncbi:MAG: proline reductase-associated electron transfer protein PrdC, partial [Lachnospiraceae bacterium]|nr:proline reductase-associated electron transfer protein PrdC [Lachnospiraceae bacterium]
GCTDILIGNCSDCTNTVMGSAPKLGLTVHHQIDHVFDTVGLERMRYLYKSKTVSQNPTEPEAPGEASSDTINYHIEQTIQDGILRIDIKEGKNIHIELPL